MDREAFWSHIGPLQVRLFRFALIMLKNRQDAEDALHDVIEKIWKKRKNLSRQQNIDGYAMSIMKNHCIDMLRKQKRLTSIELKDSDHIVSSGYEQRNLVEVIKMKISDLPLQQRMIIELKDFQGFRYEEISEMMNIPVTTLRVLLSRARKKVTKSIENEYHGN